MHVSNFDQKWDMLIYVEVLLSRQIYIYAYSIVISVSILCIVSIPQM